MYIPKTLHEENVHNNYLMGLIFSTSWRVDPTKKNSLRGSGFLEFCTQKYRILRKWKFANFWCFQKIRLKGFLLENWPRKPPWASLARSALEPPWASLARSVPKPSPHRTRIFSPTTSTSCKPEAKRWLWKKVSEWSEWSEWVKWSVFGPLIFLKLIYIIDHLYT